MLASLVLLVSLARAGEEPTADPTRAAWSTEAGVEALRAYVARHPGTLPPPREPTAEERAAALRALAERTLQAPPPKD